MNTELDPRQIILLFNSPSESNTATSAIRGCSSELAGICIDNVRKIERRETELSRVIKTLTSEIKKTLGNAGANSDKIIDALLNETLTFPQIGRKIEEAISNGTYSSTLMVSTIPVMKKMEIYFSGIEEEAKLLRTALVTVDTHEARVKNAQTNLNAATQSSYEVERRISSLKSELASTEDTAQIAKLDKKISESGIVANRRGKSMGTCQRLLNEEISRCDEVKVETDSKMTAGLNKILNLVRTYKDDCAPKVLTEDELNKIVDEAMIPLVEARTAELEKKADENFAFTLAAMIRDGYASGRTAVPEIFETGTTSQINKLKKALQKGEIPGFVETMLKSASKVLVESHLEHMFLRPKDGPDTRTSVEHEANKFRIQELRRIAIQLDRDSNLLSFKAKQKRSILAGSMIYNYAAGVLAKLTAPDDEKKRK